MDIINMDEGVYEPRESLPGSSVESASSSIFESYDTSEQTTDTERQSDDEDLKEDLQKNIPECYKSDLNFTSQNITEDDEFQATALCQFMDILNDLDEVLDKSLLACLDDTKRFDSDEEDLICKIKEYIEDRESSESLDDTEVICSAESSNQIPIDQIPQSSIGRSKSFSDITETVMPVLQSASTNTLRNSMRRLDPIVLPAISQQSEPLTLPVILFLEHHVLRPTSAPIQLQVTAANLSQDSASGPLIVGRRTLLMNRTLSLPSPGESEITAEWSRNTNRNTARSGSVSSSSTESSNGVPPINQSPFIGTDDRHDDHDDAPLGVWPHRMSAMLACLSCTVGIFNISRFAMFSVHFGASFIVQFLILSLVIGIPLFTLHLCLGQVLESGPIDMWRISPIFQGVGISLLLTQAVIGIYSIVGLSWIFVYFRDSFINADDKYKWALPRDFSFDDPAHINMTNKVHETIPQYFHGEVLQRTSNSSSFGTLKFQVALYVTVIWMIVFVSLSKGLRSYGKAVYVFIFLPICGTLVLCTKLLTLIPYDSVTNIFAETEWSEFFLINHSWAAAVQETFLTWGLLGACVMQLTSHKDPKHKNTSMLQRDSACVVAFTIAVLLLASFLANTCMQVLKSHGYVYIPGSFETIKSSQFIWPTSEPLPGNAASAPVRYMGQYGSLVGVTVWRQGNLAKTFSGWQPLQLATEIVPATLAVLPANLMSPAWAVIFYFILIMFGLAQQLAIWHCVVAGLMAINRDALRVWETSITFFSCVFGLAMGLLLCTDAGIRIIHFIDYVWVGAWWQCVLQVSLAIGVFVVRGRPYSADIVVAALYKPTSRISAVLSFVWTVILPVSLTALCVMDFRVGQHRQLYSWRKAAAYWPIWCHQTAVLLQQSALLLVPAVAVLQTWRYMNKGPSDILERVQNLYRPRMGSPHEWRPPGEAAAPAAPQRAPPPDPPPKYTPPPSYSTATGARLLNTIRRSFRTLRRMTTHRTENSEETAQLPITLSETVDRNTNTPTLAQTPPTHTHALTLDETDGHRPSSSHSLNITRDLLRRSFMKTDSRNLRSSLRRSFKYGINSSTLTTSHEHLVHDVEPISNTVAMSAMLGEQEATHNRSIASVI
ncbi:unnamed protein product [Leptosia nina]|uniref:Uncharacterized protein n=1 Tax=Leptosia nina TaxID=320188 RepID=A0AAV1K294_9NEOP